MGTRIREKTILDALQCPRCSARMRILAAIHCSEAIQKILQCLGLPSRAPPIALASRAVDMDERDVF